MTFRNFSLRVIQTNCWNLGVVHIIFATFLFIIRKVIKQGIVPAMFFTMRITDHICQDPLKMTLKNDRV